MSSPAVAVPDLPMLVRVDNTVPVLSIPEGLEFEPLRAWVRDQLPAHADAIGGRSIRLDLGGRDLKLFDVRRLIHLLREEFTIEVTGLYVQPDALHRYAERELKLKLFLQPTPPADEPAPAADATTEIVAVEVPEGGPADAERVVPVSLPNDLDVTDLPAPAPAPPGRDEPQTRTMAVHRTLRSGTSVRFDGDVVLYGDVNPGAHLVATGNIVVLGALKGMAHAGAGGDEDAFILALSLRPTQLRIGRKIAVLPDRDPGSVPERARVEDGQIVIEPFASRLRG